MENPINTENKYRTVAVKATPFIIIGGICIGFGWRFMSRSMNRKQRYNLPRSMTLAALHGGKPVLERLVDYHNHRGKATDKADVDIQELETLLGKEQPPFRELQLVLSRLEMSRREDEAIKLLEKALEKARKEAKSQEAYEIEMLLAEMYIYKGDVQKASKCKCLTEHEEVSDARRPLYMAMISMMDHQEQDALKYWESFKENQILTNPPSSDDKEFVELKNAVSLLKHDIDAAKQHKKKQANTALIH
ncbi:hypothetical protein DITRI_Ditri02bG0055600 [Diplodiscus trichospermus]